MWVRKWAAKFDFPYKIISDSGSGLRDDFINQLEKLGIDHKPSSAYHPASNSLAERAVQSLKSVLGKSPENLDELGWGRFASQSTTMSPKKGAGQTMNDF